ncbi:DUF397 domain-containing protein [Streptomyces sp. NPDC052095]|uniref:DUF397 domain-containing protein n=1 Tax=Streptomyces sp. NPDC052095 TaxID=3155678 RepID=UPI0034506A75
MHDEFADEATCAAHRSSHSNGDGNCVEVAHLGGAVAVRDSKQQAGTVLTCASEGWQSFVGSVADGGL